MKRRAFELCSLYAKCGHWMQFRVLAIRVAVQDDTVVERPGLSGRDRHTLMMAGKCIAPFETFECSKRRCNAVRQFVNTSTQKRFRSHENRSNFINWIPLKCVFFLTKTISLVNTHKFCVSQKLYNFHWISLWSMNFRECYVSSELPDTKLYAFKLNVSTLPYEQCSLNTILWTPFSEGNRTCQSTFLAEKIVI